MTWDCEHRREHPRIGDVARGELALDHPPALVGALVALFGHLAASIRESGLGLRSAAGEQQHDDELRCPTHSRSLPEIARAREASRLIG